MTELCYLETRDITLEGRRVIGRVVPYNETSYLVPGPNGERIRRGAFTRSIRERGDKIFLHREHKGERVGKAIGDRWRDDDDGLIGEFEIRKSALGDQTLEELADGYWPYMSVGFRPLGPPTRGSDGVPEVREAFLGHVALVGCAAYEGAQVLAVRDGNPKDVLAGFAPRPDLDALVKAHEALVSALRHS